MNNANGPGRSSFGGGIEGERLPGSTMGQDQFSSSQGQDAEGGAKGGLKNMASQASEKLKDTAERQKQAGADFATDMAGAVRRAAGEFEDQMPQAAEYIRYAADQIETVSQSIRRRDVGQMINDVQSFARRQPTAFLGMTFLAGFAAMRFLRSSSAGQSSFGRRDWREDNWEDDGRYGAPGRDVPGSMSPGAGL